MRYLSTFSGIGGFEIPMQEKGWECIGYSEINKPAIKCYSHHFPSHHNYGDITNLDVSGLPDFDLLCGGFPCQSFSIAGKRGGFKDTRGTLFFHLAEIARAKRPSYLFFENVKGLLSHDEGNTFATIITAIDQLGYDLQWSVIDSQWHGVPQQRERVFIVGHLRDLPRPKVFPLQEGNRLSEESRGEGEQSQVASTIAANLKRGVYARGETYIRFGTFCGKATTPDGVADTITHSYGELSGDGTKVFDGDVSWDKIRRLMPLECERCQGFPDNWTAMLPDTKRYECIGNAVTVNVIRAIVDRLHKHALANRLS